MDIRVYRENDRGGVVALWREVFPDAPPHNDPATDIERKLAVQPELFLVAADGGRIVGTAMAGYDGHRGWIYYVAVSPRHRRRGTGTALMRSAEQRLAALGCSKINLQVRGSNPHAVQFYESLGYSVEDRISMGRLIGGRER
jgi:ribosomal protein S18 acetylase RimI-like enzyme